jgi:shikimate dehydrogenase
MNDLVANYPRFNAEGSAVVVLGAGGAARAIIHAFLEAGAQEIRVFNRTRARADAVAGHFGARVKPYNWSDRVDRSRDASIFVNATSLGMKGGVALDMPLEQLDRACIVADLVYVPLMTPVPGFAKWFGITPEVTPELRALIVADIEGR